MAQILALFLAVFIYMPFVVLLNTWAASLLWGWYLTPYLAIPSFWMLAGLVITIRFIKGAQYTSSESDTQKDKLTKALFPVMYPIVAVIFGWLIFQLV